MGEVQTVDTHCKHKDCKYRGTISSLGTGSHWCMYMYITGYPRKCEISECDKYVKGRRVLLNTKEGLRFADAI